MTNIVILGFGNVGFHLCKTLDKYNQFSVIQIYNRNKISIYSELKHIPSTTKLAEIKEADMYILAIPDDAIASFSEALPLKNKLVVHTSGGAAMEALSEANRKGVFYPLQSFSKKRDPDFNEIPICIEAERKSDLTLLKKLGEAISEKVVEVNSEERAKLHLAAVFVNNFVNYMYDISSDILSKSKLPFELLRPLIAETANKIETLSPKEAQTGPAKRSDKKTIEKHLHLLENGPHKELYQQLTEAILTSYGKKL